MCKINNLLLEEHEGFSGITHCLIAICLFFLMWLIPINFSQQYVQTISTSPLFAIIIFFVIIGGALLPDLDSNPIQGGGSTAIYQLGILGLILSTFMITISGAVYSILHGKGDSKPKSQHRMLFHTLLIPILFLIMVLITVPNTNQILIQNISYNSTPQIFIAFCAIICVYLGANMALYKPLKLIGKQGYCQFVCLGFMLISAIMCFQLPYSNLRLIGIAVGLGYIFHIVGDLITEGSSPIFFPIPLKIKGKWAFWHKPYIIGHTLAIKTGGMANTILNFVFLSLDIFLAWFLFL